jgi:phage terminase Nu1 subunit (DNA packaging protein)
MAKKQNKKRSEEIMSMFEKIKDKHKTPYIKRSQLHDLTGCIITAKTMAALDCRGQGIKERIVIGRETAYSVDALIEWLENNTERVK